MKTTTLTKSQLEEMVASAVYKTLRSSPVRKTAPRSTAPRSFVRKSVAEKAIEVAAAGMTTLDMPEPSREQIEAHGGGVYGVLKARRALQRTQS